MLTSAENVDLLMRLVGVVIVDDRHLVRKVIVFGSAMRSCLVSVVAKPRPRVQISGYCGPGPPSRSLAAT
jgi:hypothetical protein